MLHFVQNDSTSKFEIYEEMKEESCVLASMPCTTLRHPDRCTRLQRFVERYGVLERMAVEKEYGVENRGQTYDGAVEWFTVSLSHCPGVCPPAAVGGMTGGESSRAVFHNRLFLPLLHSPLAAESSPYHVFAHAPRLMPTDVLR